MLRRAFARWEAVIEAGIGWYVRQLDRAMNHRLLVVLGAVGLLAGDARRALGPGCAASSSRRSTPAPSRSTPGPPAARASRRPRRRSPGSSNSSASRSARTCRSIISELGVVADLSAAYTPNAGPMDAVVKVQLKHEREHSAQEYVHKLRTRLRRRSRVPRPGVCLRRRRHDPLGDE